MPINRSILPTCSNDHRTSNGVAIRHNTACLGPTLIRDRVSKVHRPLRQRRALVRYENPLVLTLFDVLLTISRDMQVYSFVPIPGAQQHKRPRRRYEEIERMYKCGWNGCEKAYGTLNHLNAHVTMQSHGTKRTPEGNEQIPLCFHLIVLALYYLGGGSPERANSV